MKFPLIIAILIGVLVFLIGLLLSIWLYKKEDKKMAKVERRREDPWLFNNFHKKLYRAMFRRKDPDVIARKFAINPEKYYEACTLTGTKPDIEKLIANRMYALLVLALGSLLSILINPLIMVFTVLIFVLLMIWEQQKILSRAKDMKEQIEDEVPDFLDLLKTELAVGIPIENAIPLLCRKLPDSLLAREFLAALQDMQMGATTWHGALESVATKYDDESLTNFVMDVTTSYRKGTSAADAVTRQAEDIRKEQLLRTKERATRMETTILVPITMLQIMPLLIFLLLPTFFQVLEWV